MTKLNLTQQFIKTAICPPEKAKWDLFDSNCKGLQLEIRKSGGKTYYLKYTDVRGRVRLIKIADERDISLAQARQLADKYRNQIAMGEDPAEKKQNSRRFQLFLNLFVKVIFHISKHTNALGIRTNHYLRIT